MVSNFFIKGESVFSHLKGLFLKWFGSYNRLHAFSELSYARHNFVKVKRLVSILVKLFEKFQTLFFYFLVFLFVRQIFEEFVPLIELICQVLIVFIVHKKFVVFEIIKISYIFFLKIIIHSIL